MSFPEWVIGQENPEVPVNEGFDILAYAAVYARDPDITTGLTWGYLGGRWSGFAITGATLSLTNAATNYIVVERATGAISVSTASTNWDNNAEYARVYQLTTAGGVVTATQDHRAGDAGIFGSSGGGGGSIATLSDVDLTGLADGDVLVYDLATNTWVPETPSGGGGSGLSGNPAFSAFASTATTLTTNTFVKVGFQTEEYDVGGNFASSRFTPTVPGIYHFTTAVGMSTNAASIILAFYKNGSAAKRADSPSGAFSWSSSASIYLNGAGDYVEVFCRQTSTNNNSTGSVFTYFQGALISS